MMPIKKHISTIVLIILILICLGTSILYSQQGNTYENVQMLYQGSNAISGSEAIDMEKTESKEDVQVNYTLWGEIKGQSVAYPELYRTAKVTAMVISGESRLILDSSWNLTANDKTGCLIDETTAYALFGDTDVVGQVIKFDNKEYTIRGLVKKAEKVIVVQSTSATKAVMNYIAVEILMGESASDIAENFASRHGVSSESLDYNMYSSWSAIIVMILPLLLSVSVIYVLIKTVFNAKETPVKCAVYAGITLIYIVIAFWVIKSNLSYPETMIPSRWSDFSFWSNLYSEQVEKVITLLRTEKSLPELKLISPFVETAKYSVLGIILYIIMRKRVMVDKTEELVLYLVAAFIGAFVSVYLCGQDGNLIANNRIIWYLVPVYLCGRYLSGRMEQQEKEETQVKVIEEKEHDKEAEDILPEK